MPLKTSSSNTLQYAIESGAFELVLFLINNGADVHEYYGPFQKSTAHLSIARLSTNRDLETFYNAPSTFDSWISQDF